MPYLYYIPDPCSFYTSFRSTVPFIPAGSRMSSRTPRGAQTLSDISRSASVPERTV